MPLDKKSSAANEALGRSRGGFTTKLHALCDALGNPMRFLLTPGQCADITQARALLDRIEAGAVIADKGYDADWLVAHLSEMGASVVIPPKRNRLVQR
ncbi:MAG TPA: transposase, partial [Rhodothermales bacterium]|nr:transposase [Rhodothermales bacterium]